MPGPYPWPQVVMSYELPSQGLVTAVLLWSAFEITLAHSTNPLDLLDLLPTNPRNLPTASLPESG